MCNCLKIKANSKVMQKMCVCKNHKAYCCYGHYISFPYDKNGKDYKNHVKIA